MEPEFTYSDLCDLVASEMKRASDRGLFTIEEGGLAFMIALEHLQTVPEKLGMASS